MNSKLLTIMLCAALTSGLLAGCASGSEGVNDRIATDAADTQIVAVSSVNSVANASSLNADDMFTDRDKEIGYDEASCVKITLKDGASTSDSSSVNINGDTVTISDEGTYILSGSLTDGQIIIASDSSSKIQLVLDNVNINCRTSAAVYVKEADKVFITLASGSVNSLSNTEDFVAIDDNNIDAVIFSKSVLTLNGGGTLNVNAAYGHGILSKDDLKFTSGTYIVSAASSALSGKDSVRIADGEFNITAGKDGIHSENADNEEKGFIYISGGSFLINADSDGLDSSCTMQIDGGTFNIAVADDAFHSDADLIVNGGNIDISTCYEGLEGQTITINSGTINLYATDDGFNAAGGNDQSGFGGPEDGGMNQGMGGNMGHGDAFGSDSNCIITINGGIININADGDGIDSNGDLIINGGEIYVSGPTSNADGPLDYGGNAKITGGSIIAIGSGGMAQNFGSDSTQGAIMINLSSYADAGSEITLKDSNGNTLISYIAEKKYNSVLVSCSNITDGGTYTITADGNDTTVTMDGLIYGSGMGDGFGGGFGGGMDHGGMKDGKHDDDFDVHNGHDNIDKPFPDGETPPDIPEGGFTAPDGSNNPDMQGAPNDRKNLENGDI